jgi:dolichol-phosphate mannosyltransferase
MVTVFGFLLAGLGFLLGLLFTIIKIIDPSSSPRGLPALGILITFFSGAQILSMGVIGEYVRKIYVQSLRRPRGFIQDGVNLTHSDPLPERQALNSR